MIRFLGVSKTYRADRTTKVVMRNAYFDFPRGRNVALLGRNGAGKSTLLKLIAGAVEPDSGRIERNVRVSWPLGFGGGLHPALTGVQNVRFVARIYGVDTDDMVDRVESFAELGAFLRMPVSSYSSGMRARLAFGMSMAIDFEVFLVDEITAVGDSAFRAKCADAFKRKADTADLIMVSHAPQTILEYCDSGVVLENGALVYYDDVRHALAAHHANMARPAQ
jgi:capsular polysaccharide transport system ATP-binding protein